MPFFCQYRESNAADFSAVSNSICLLCCLSSFIADDHSMKRFKQAISTVKSVPGLQDLAKGKDDACFRAFVCAGLMDNVLHEWVSLSSVADRTLVAKWYALESVIRSELLPDAVSALEELKGFPFKLQLDYETSQLDL
mmetsp:Transcript_46430/g.119831  ORF Transcript_46430/g.119831 Transcript_46430/m.119831 type:complete len:138 (-) Transcript_46430:22-435(-)